MKPHFTQLIHATNTLQKALLLVTFLFSMQHVSAQYFTLPLSTTYPIHIDYVGGSTICQPTSATVQYGIQYFYLFPEITPTLISPDEATHHIATAGETRTVIVEVVASGAIVTNNAIGIYYKYGEAGGPDEPQLLSASPVSSPSRDGHIRIELPIKFDRATKKGYVSFLVKDGDVFNNTAIGNWVVIPFTVLGPTINNQHVEILDTIVEPQIPYLILHAPPGDGSSSTFQTSKTTCRKLETTYAEEGSNSANLAVKIGVAGMAGLFVTTEFEFSVTISAGLTVGDMAYEASSEETCLTVNEGFTTASMLDDQGGGDVFIGYGTDMAVGVYEYLRIEPGACGSTLDTGLIYAPVGDLRQFAKTKSGIEDNIAELLNVVADSANLDPKTVNDAMNQIDVWNQVLALNEANVTDPNNEPMGLAFDLDSRASIDREESIQVVNTNTITYEQYTNVNMGVVAKVEVGGSGVKGGYEFKGSKRFGQTQNQTSTESKLIKYTLSDDAWAIILKCRWFATRCTEPPFSG